MREENYLESAIRQFEQYKLLAEKAMDQISENDFQWQYNNETNSIAIIIQHLSGNMLSRWTDFLGSDGEKSWRKRDDEFEIFLKDQTSVLAAWEKGWNCLFTALRQLTPDDFEKTIFIRNEKHSVMEAINRQLTHYASHAGQIILICKMISGPRWKSITIPKKVKSV